MGLALRMPLKFYISVTKRFTLGLISMFVKVTGEKLLGSFFDSLIVNRVKVTRFRNIYDTCVLFSSKAQNEAACHAGSLSSLLVR